MHWLFLFARNWRFLSATEWRFLPGANNHVNMYFGSFVISVIVSFLLQMIETPNALYYIFGGVVTVMSFFVIILYRYSNEGQAGSYRYFIDQYELKLLQEKIDVLESSIQITDKDENALELKQAVIDELISIRKKCVGQTNKKKIEKDINTVEQLDLCIGVYDSCQERKIYIKNQKFNLIYDLERGKENNYIGALNLKNENYSALYEILKKYDLISYVEE